MRGWTVDGGGVVRASLVYNMRLFSCKISAGSQSDYSLTGTHCGAPVRDWWEHQYTEQSTGGLQMNLEYMQYADIT